MLCREVQFAKAAFIIPSVSVPPDAKVTCVRLVQFSKALEPMLVIDAGRETLFNPAQPERADASILVYPSGMATEVMAVFSLKAPASVVIVYSVPPMVAVAGRVTSLELPVYPVKLTVYPL